MSPRFILLVALALLAVLAALAEEGNGWCLHQQMYAVPAPKKVVIDGKLDDWDLSGAIDAYVMPETRETQNARFALMFDRQALYVGAIIRDPTPLQNHNAPETEGHKGWDGDSMQFRICVDPAHKYPPSDMTWLKEHDLTLVSLTLWQYTERTEPVLVAQRGMGYEPMPGSAKFGVMPRGSFQATYVPAADGRGYSVEYRIPWATLGAEKPPQGGDTVASAMQVMWGRSGNEHIGINGVTYDLQTGGGFAYQNSSIWGKVIFSKTGKLPKELVSAGLPPEKPMPLTFPYDLPESSQVTLQLYNDANQVVRVLAGEALRTAGQNLERWDGLDALGNPLPAGRYTWKGLYHQPITTKHVLSVANSGQPPWKTDSNTGGWGGDHGVPCGSCRVGNDVVLSWNVAEAGYGIIRVTAEGKKQWGILRSAIHMTSDGDRLFLSNDTDGDIVNPLPRTEAGLVEIVDKKDFRPLLFPNGAKGLEPPPGGEAATNGVSGLACANSRVYVAYRQRNLIAVYDAREGTLKETLTVNAPGALAVRADGALVAVSDGKLVVVQNGRVQPLATRHLDAPQGVAIDADGQVYVSNGGRLQNVSVFAADGGYLRSIGTPGGRPRIGAFSAAGMLCPTALTIDSLGQLWVTESIDSPKRVSVWDTRQGRLLKDYYGDAAYSSFTWMDRERPTEIYCDGVLWTVDLQQKTWAPKTTLWRPSDRNSPGQYSFYGNGLRLFTAKNGRQYGWAIDEHVGCMLSIREGDIMKPFLGFFWTYTAKRYIGYPVAFDTKKYPEWGTYIWVDANDDQIIQEAEVQIAAKLSPEAAKRYFRNFTFVDTELNLWHDRGAVNRPLRILPDGRPEYDFSKPELLPMAGIASVDDAGDLYTLAPDTRNTPKIGWGKWRADGTLQWGHGGFVDWPNAISLPSQQPGKLWGPTAIIGHAGGYTGFMTYFGVPHVYTTDGLFVSRLFKDVRTVTSLGPEVISCENANGQLVQPKGTDRFYFLGGDQDGRVSEVLGLDTVKRLPGGTYVITENDAKIVATAMADYQAKLSRAQPLRIVHGKAALATARSIRKTLDTTRQFEARVAYDDTNLYVQYTVTSPVKLVNDVPDPQLVFKGGNALDIQFAADPKADPQRKTPVPGDVRIVVTRQKGETLAVVYRPKVPGFTGTPVVFRTANTESFDSVEVSKRITLDYGENKNLPTFTALVTIPLDLLGWKPQPGAKVRMDLGFIYGNNEGSKAMARSYWANNGFSANVLNDVPNESKLTPNEWGTADCE
jgi:hypothetical protein